MEVRIMKALRSCDAVTETLSGRETRLRRREERSEWLRGEEYEWKEEKEKKKRDSRSG